MAVVLKESQPLFREALRLSRQAGLVYALLWEAAWHDDRRGKWGQRECGGTTALSHESIAKLCHLSKTTVIQAANDLMDDGLISCMWLEPRGEGPGRWKRRYRVLHSSQVEAQRHAISVMPVKPSERAAAIRDRKEQPAYGETIQLLELTLEERVG